MASFMLDVRPFGTRKAEVTKTHRVVKGLSPLQAAQSFGKFVSDTAYRNNWVVMGQSPIDATFRRKTGTTPCAYAMIEVETPPSAPEKGQPRRAKAQ